MSLGRQRYQGLDGLHQAADADGAPEYTCPGSLRHATHDGGEEHDGSPGGPPELFQGVPVLVAQGIPVEHDEAHWSAPRLGCRLVERHVQISSAAGVVAHLAEGGSEQRPGPLVGDYEQDSRGKGRGCHIQGIRRWLRMAQVEVDHRGEPLRAAAERA